MTASVPKCPKCGQQVAKPLSTEDGYLNNPPQPGERPISTATVYLCQCGETFTHVVKHVRRK